MRSLTLRRTRMVLTWHLTVASVMPSSPAIFPTPVLHRFTIRWAWSRFLASHSPWPLIAVHSATVEENGPESNESMTVGEVFRGNSTRAMTVCRNPGWHPADSCIVSTYRFNRDRWIRQLFGASQCALRVRFITKLCGNRLRVSCHSPPTVSPFMRMVGAATEPRNSRSLAMSEMLMNISFKFPATVISSTGYVSSPPEIQSPDAPRE